MVGGQAHNCATQTVAMAQFSADLIMLSLAKSTVNSYNKIVQEYINWVGSLEPGLNMLSVTPLHVSMYMEVLFSKGLSPATISSRLSAIAFWHKPGGPS